MTVGDAVFELLGLLAGNFCCNSSEPDETDKLSSLPLPAPLLLE